MDETDPPHLPQLSLVDGWTVLDRPFSEGKNVTSEALSFPLLNHEHRSHTTWLKLIMLSTELFDDLLMDYYSWIIHGLFMDYSWIIQH